MRMRGKARRRRPRAHEAAGGLNHREERNGRGQSKWPPPKAVTLASRNTQEARGPTATASREGGASTAPSPHRLCRRRPWGPLDWIRPSPDARAAWTHDGGGPAGAPPKPQRSAAGFASAPPDRHDRLPGPAVGRATPAKKSMRRLPRAALAPCSATGGPRPGAAPPRMRALAAWAGIA